MTSPLRISGVRFTPASPAEVRTGLFGYTSFLLDGRIRIDGATVRRTRRGDLVLSFPAKPGRRGREWPYIRPVDDETRRSIEAQVLAAIGLAPEGSR